MSVHAVCFRGPDDREIPFVAAGHDLEGSVSLLIDDHQALVVLHGAIGSELHQDIRDLVTDLEAGVAAGRPIVVLASQVTQLDLQGVWLLLELRRAAAGHGLRIDEPSVAVNEALGMLGLGRLLEIA